ncbi:hypothetical protein VTN31DRAFT_3033 [Thermomyces dupontii]|uniref:uncharacterized protein n=1 Tax=Talaromyces thermophilus TaxID=28565 RepID=UPI003743F421
MYDVGSLPLELLVQVVEYLDPEDILRSQGVSKRWRTIFSSDSIITRVLRETLAFLGLDQEGVSTDGTIADPMSYFQWRHGLLHARPVKKIFLPWPAHFFFFTCLVLSGAIHAGYTMISRAVAKSK